MSPPSLLFAAAALVPAMTAPADGAPQLSAASALLAALCNGGSMVLPLAPGAPQPATPCCCAKGYKRKRIDRKQ
jgi:hypothetical protein